MRLTIKMLEQGRPVTLSVCGLELTVESMEKEDVISIVADERGVILSDNVRHGEIESICSESTDSTACGDITAIHDNVIHNSVTLETTSEEELFGVLVTLRRRLAQQQKVPPYVIFNDKSLREMVQKLPTDLTSFGCISGVGKSKLEKYGRIFLDTIQTFHGKMAG